MAIKKVVAAVSGGVDSAVAAYLLKSKGFQVSGVFMRNWDKTDEQGFCSADKDAEDAKYICDKIGISFREVNFVENYWCEVFSPLVEGYLSGKTPNPDVLCNKHIKFGHFFKYVVDHLGADAIATGHYARNSLGQFLENNSDKRAKLLKSLDQSKDQTLFLSQISQEALQKTMFPVGGLYKSSVKQMAVDIGLEAIAKKKESTGICFIGKQRKFPKFLRQYSEPSKGVFVDIETNEVVGQHEGVHDWTIGERAKIGGQKKAYFVTKRDPVTQTISVVQGTDHPALFSNSLTTAAAHWIDQNPFTGEQSIKCQFRFQHTYTPIDCEVLQNHGMQKLHVYLSEPVRALAAGQYAIFYSGEECLGSAEILNAGIS